MKKLSYLQLPLLALIVGFIGCDAAQQAAQDAAATATEQVGDMANIDFGDFDMDGMKEKFTGITDGFKDVSSDNVDGLTSKISDLGGSIEGMGIESLPAPAKTAVSGLMSKFGDTVKTAMDGISDEGILSKLKPAVEGLMEKIGAFQ